jgi:hypothetical protein
MPVDERPVRRVPTVPHVLRVALTGRDSWLFVSLLAVVLTSTSLTVGLVVDDYFHRAVLLGSRIFGDFLDSPMDIFCFLDGDPERTSRMVDLGFLPWWTCAGIKASFWRPLTVFTHWLDYHLWPEHPVLMHLHSLAWFAVAVALVTLLYRRFMPSVGLAGLAGLLYAIDDGHGMPVGFLANRNALLAVVFGVLALIAHDRWRREHWRAGAVLGPLLLALSLVSKEAGIATCAYLAAHALFFDRAGLRSRCLALVPYACVVIAWRAVWEYLGYGLAYSGPYVDPGSEPLRYALAVPKHAPLLLLGQWAFPPAESYLVLGFDKLLVLWLGAVGFLIVLTIALIPPLRRDPSARFWGTGMFLSLLPACATFPADRLLFFVGIGAMGLLAQLLDGVFGKASWRPKSTAWRFIAKALGLFFVFIHLIVAPIALPIRAAFPAGPKSTEKYYVRVDLDPSVEDQDVVIVNPPSILHAAYFLVEQEVAGKPVPRRMRLLAPGLQAVQIERTDERTLLIRPEKGFLSWVFERLFRDEQLPWSVSERIELTGVTIEVMDLTADGRPAVVAFRFDARLEDPSLRWLQFKDQVWQPFTPPAVGQRVVLPAGKPFWSW